MKNTFLTAILLSFAPAAFAVCPSIEGDWALTYDEVFNGFTLAGIGLATFDSDTGEVRVREGYQGEHFIDNFTGPYIVQGNCMIRWNYKQAGGGTKGVAHGVIVSPNKMFLMLSNPGVESTTRILAERIEY
jgi:hypothetical protein